MIQEYLKATKKASMSGWQDWGHLDAEMTELVARLSGLTMNIIVNLHIKDTKVGGSDDGDGGYLVKSPKLKGDLKDQIAAEFDLVGFMETGWEAVDGKRSLARYIQWEPTPDKPIAKDRSGQLPKKTPVTFTTEDYEGLLRPLRAAQDLLTTSSVVAEVETEVAAEHVKVSKGGPVEKSVASQATPKAAKKAAPPPVPKATTPVAAAPVPVQEAKPEPPATEEQAVAAVQEVLGGTVVDPEPKEGPPTPVVRNEVPTGPSSAESEPEVAADIPGTGIITVACGQPRYNGGTVPDDVNACGQELVLDMQDERVTGVKSPEGQNPDLIEIGGLRTRAFLCNSCFSAHRKSSKK